MLAVERGGDFLGDSGSGAPADDWSASLALAMALISFCSETLYGATSFGPAITFNVGWQICFLLHLCDGTLTSVAVNMMKMELCVACLQITCLRRKVDPWLALAISLPCCSFMALGQALMLSLDGPWLKRALGAILLLMALQRVGANCGSHSASEGRPAPAGLDLTSPKVMCSICFWFSAAGLMGGITTVAGPPMMLFVSYHQHELDLLTWRASNAVLRLLLNLSRASVFIADGRLEFHSRPLEMAMVGGGCAGLLLGNRLARCFKGAASLHWWMVSLLLFASVLMVAAGSSEEVQRDASLAVGVTAAVFGATGAGAALWTRWCRSARSEKINPTDRESPADALTISSTAPSLNTALLNNAVGESCHPATQSTSIPT